MSCPSCGHRKARRECPALGQTICTVCCGTKRLTEINCPSDCTYLASAREHPAAVIRRQQEHDLAILLPSIRHLTERQRQLFFLFQSVIANFKPEGFGRLADDDVAEAAGTLAATLETATRGVIYEHEAQSPIAQDLARAMKGLLEEVRGHGTQVYDGETAITLRAIEQGARETRTVTGGEATAYLALMGRLLHVNRATPGGPAADTPAGRQSSIILP